MKQIKRFYRQNRWICYICILSTIIVVLRISTMELPEIFNYGEEIFSLIYDLSLAVIGSVIFYYIVEFYSKDKIQEKYEKTTLKYLKYINYSMKDMIYVLDDKYDEKYLNKSDQIRGNIEDAANKIFANVDKIPCVIRKPNGDSSERLDRIFEQQKNINDNIAIVINNFAKFMSDDDLDLLTSTRIRNIGADIWMNKENNFNHMVTREAAREHIEIQKKIEKRIKEIEESI